MSCLKLKSAVLFLKIYVIFPRFINNPPAQRERDCHDQEIEDSKNKKKNVIDGVRDLTNII